MITIESTERIESQGETKKSLGIPAGTKIFVANDPKITQVTVSGTSYPLSNSKLQDMQTSELNS